MTIPEDIGRALSDLSVAFDAHGAEENITAMVLGDGRILVACCLYLRCFGPHLCMALASLLLPTDEAGAKELGTRFVSVAQLYMEEVGHGKPAGLDI